MRGRRRNPHSLSPQVQTYKNYQRRVMGQWSTSTFFSPLFPTHRFRTMFTYALVYKNRKKGWYAVP